MIPESVPSLYAGSIAPPRKLRLRIVTRHPLPELHFLAPFDPTDATCFTKLQAFIHAHLVAKVRHKVDMSGPEKLRLQMDDFEVTFDDPEILRDGDTLEVYIAEEERDGDMDSEENEVAAVVLGGVEADREHGLEAGVQDVEERQALLEASRVAALLRAGLHTMDDDDDDDDDPTRPSALDDLPRMPSLQPPQAPNPSKGTRSKPSTSLPAPPLPPMPMSLAQGPAAAMAAFEARSQAMAAKSRATAIQQSASGAQTSRKRARSASSSSSSSASDSSSHSSSNSDGSDSDSDSDSDSVSDSDSSSSSSSSSSSAPSEHPTTSDRPPQPRLPSPTPPGQGTSRTKRRNQMRRHKLTLLRQAENLATFQRAHQRALLRESAVEPSAELRIRGSAADAAASAVEKAEEDSAGSAPMVDAVAALSEDIAKVVEQTGKRKRGEGAEVEEEVQTEQAAYGQVPKGMVVRHVDCQSYYDAEWAKMEARAELQPQQGQAHDASRQADEPGFFLDYGDPSPSSSAAPQSKKPKLEPSTALGPQPRPHADAWHRIRSAFQPTFDATLLAKHAIEPNTELRVGTGVVWKALALHPVTCTPECLWFAGVVVGVEGGVEVDAIGPLVGAGWEAYEVRRLRREAWPDEAWIV